MALRCGNFSPWSVDLIAFELVAKPNIMGAVHTAAELFVSWLGHKRQRKQGSPALFAVIAPVT